MTSNDIIESSPNLTSTQGNIDLCLILIGNLVIRLTPSTIYCPKNWPKRVLPDSEGSKGVQDKANIRE